MGMKPRNHAWNRWVSHNVQETLVLNMLIWSYLVMKKKELKFKVIWGSSTDFRQNVPHLAISSGGFTSLANHRTDPLWRRKTNIEPRGKHRSTINYFQWIGLREQLQETLNMGFSCKFSLNPIHQLHKCIQLVYSCPLPC